MMVRVKREKLNNYTYRALDDAMYKMEGETNGVELMQIILAPLRDSIIYKERQDTRKEQGCKFQAKHHGI